MRVLLVRPGRPQHYHVPPLGLLYLAASLRRAGHEPHLFDPTLHGASQGAFEARLRDLRPGFVGVSLHSSDLAVAGRRLGLVRRALPGVPCVAGGPHVSARPTIVREPAPTYDAGVVGEGEQPIVHLVDGWARSGVLPDGPGIVGPDGPEGAAVTAWRPSDLDELPLPAWDLAPPASYRGAPQGFVFRRTPIAPILTSRGCPHACTFCGGRAVMGRRFRARSVASVLDEVDWLRARFGVRELHVIDDTFTAHRDRARGILAGLEPRRLTLSFPNGLRADDLDDDLARALRRAGTFAVNLGIESGTQAILDRVAKGLRLEQVADAVVRLHRAGISVGGFFILGFPGETEADVRRTIQLALDLPLDRAHFSAYLPLPGTPEGDRLADVVRPDDLSYDAVPWAPEGMTVSRLKALQREAFLRFYLRPRAAISLAGQLRSTAHLRAAVARGASYIGWRRDG